MNKLVLFLILGTLSLSAISQPELKGSLHDLRQFLYLTERVVTIYGEAEKKAYSDKAIVSLVITTENKLLSASISENSRLRESIGQLLIDSGLPANTIKSSKFSSSPQYRWFGKKPASYKVVNRMAISIVKENHLKEIASVADKYQEIELAGTIFEHTEKDEYNNQVKIDALDKIMKQKQFYEKALGVKLTPVGFKDTNIRQRATGGAGAIEEIVVTATRLDSGSGLSSSKYREEPQTPSFDEVKYQASLAVDFKIDKKIHSK